MRLYVIIEKKMVKIYKTIAKTEDEKTPKSNVVAPVFSST